ncbi:MAG: GHKL domain-containing protein [Taibaiella sp.]|nr:GHKL domain-containing protein [Taibaiella sp.]
MSTYNRIPLFLLLICLLTSLHLNAQEYQVLSGDERILVGKGIAYMEMKDSTSLEEALKNGKFTTNDKDILNFGLSDSYYWIRLPLVNHTRSSSLSVIIDQAILNMVQIFQPDSLGAYHRTHVAGTSFPFSKRDVHSPSYIFPANVRGGDTAVVYLQVKSNSPLIIPIIISRNRVALEYLNQRNSVFYAYLGIMACMFLYNVFLMFSIKKDRSYMWYAVHTLLVALTQASFLGYAFQFLWPDSPWIAQQSFFILTCLVSIVGIIFMQEFLQTRKYTPRVNRFFLLFFISYGIIILLSLLGLGTLAYKMLQPTQILVALFILYLASTLVRRGYKQARFYLLSWSLFMVAIILFALKDFNIIPYNTFTATIMLTGSALQVILLSFALADKINILQATTIQVTRENLKIIKEKNAELEMRVQERTQELLSSNEELTETLEDLKETQTQLVESEKMASLGQLTAGIAHEINNPINFVTSNVSPLKRDVGILLDSISFIESVGLNETLSMEEKKNQIEAYKQDADIDYLKMELDQLLKGIHEGASRTAEIVKGLRIFSRVDEDTLKFADINEGLESTIIIINNLLDHIQVEKHYGEIPLVECYPGKLNQVFLNLFTNAIHAIEEKYGRQPGGRLTISTYCDEHDIFISIADNGTGMSEETKNKIFEPFFTTKEVGQGTGLGMSIAYNTLKKHNGQILIKTEESIGTEFVLQFPLQQPDTTL